VRTASAEACVRVEPVRSKRFAAALAALLVLSLAQAQAALAADGVGLAGRPDDRTITLTMFGVIVFFPILVIGLSIIQGRLEARKDRRRYDLERLG
jgi:hypothetical protein